jgi:hypothetical protein
MTYLLLEILQTHLTNMGLTSVLSHSTNVGIMMCLVIIVRSVMGDRTPSFYEGIIVADLRSSSQWVEEMPGA